MPDYIATEPDGDVLVGLAWAFAIYAGVAAVVAVVWVAL